MQCTGVYYIQNIARIYYLVICACIYTTNTCDFKQMIQIFSVIAWLATYVVSVIAQPSC